MLCGQPKKRLRLQNLCVRISASARRPQGRLDELHYGSSLERLFQESDRARLQGERPISLVRKGGNKNDRCVAIEPLETALQLDAVHAGHLDVADET